MDGRFSGWLGTAIVATAFCLSFAVSLYHVLTHEAPLLPTILGQGSLLALSLGFGYAGYDALTSVETPSQRDVVGVRAGLGFALGGLAAAGYALHRSLTPGTTMGSEVVLFQAAFVALVGGTAGVLVGTEKARRERILADVTEATRRLDETKADIRTEKRRFESLFQNSPSAVVDLQYSDGEPTVDRANAAFEALIDGPVAEVEGKNLFEVVPLRETETEEEVADHVAGNEIYEGEVTVERSDDVSHHKLRVIPYEVGKEGERAFAVYTDVTELRETRERLAESVDRLEESNERLEQFAYAASHDLQEPLRMVSSYLQLLEDRYADELDEDAREFIDFAVDGADRMRSMIESLLEYSRVTTSGAPMEPTDAEAVLEDVLDDLRLRIEETDATVTSGELPTVTADADQLAQVFRNLVSNAITYSGDEPPVVHVGCDRAGDEWQFSVADQGIGMDADQRDRIFDIFETVHTAEEGSGSGIGLALCERIVDRHGGEIRVESEPDEGTTFYFTIPATETQRQASLARPGVQRRANGSDE